MKDVDTCLCCRAGQPITKAKVCPVCGHRFQGNGWDGIDSHWKAKHLEVMGYDKFWGSLCNGHRGTRSHMRSSASSEAFEQFLLATNEAGSGKASSYLRALQLLEEMLSIESFGFADCHSIYEITDLNRLGELVSLVREQQRNINSAWFADHIPKSYLENGYCSAALGAYIHFLAERSESICLLQDFESHKGSGAELSIKLDRELVDPGRFVTQERDLEGEDVLRVVKNRRNQYVFRNIISDIHRGECCISGLNIPELNRASHIVPWSQDKSARLNPCNGLFLSATYDAAFDRNLITLDESYRVIVSKQIKNCYSNGAVSEYFHRVEGTRIRVPEQYVPDQKYLKKHREALL